MGISAQNDSLLANLDLDVAFLVGYIVLDNICTDGA